VALDLLDLGLVAIERSTDVIDPCHIMLGAVKAEVVGDGDLKEFSTNQKPSVK
jgi:hypothetical protein